MIGPGSMSVRSDQMVIQLDEGLLNSHLRYPEKPPHQDHQGEKDLRDNPPQFLRKKNILAKNDRKDEEQPPRKHQKEQKAKTDGEDERKGGMDILQSHHGNIPEQKHKEEKDQTGDDQEPDENPLPGFNLQCSPLPEPSEVKGSRIHGFKCLPIAWALDPLNPLNPSLFKYRSHRNRMP